MSLLKVEDVAKRFGPIEVLQGVTLSAEPGAITALIGPNGAGKTTLANIVSGYERPHRGRVLLGHHDVTRLPVHRRAGLGIGRTFQNLELFEELTAADNVLLGRYARHRLRWLSGPRRQDRAQVAESLARAGLAEHADDEAGALAFGQAKLVEPERVLAGGPRLVVMDEPAAGMTGEGTARLAAWMREFVAAGTAVLLIEHNMRLVMDTADYIYVLDHGELIGEGTPDEIRENPAVITAYLGAGEDA